jgi:hypothetical protein
VTLIAAEALNKGNRKTDMGRRIHYNSYFWMEKSRRVASAAPASLAEFFSLVVPSWGRPVLFLIALRDVEVAHPPDQ